MGFKLDDDNIYSWDVGTPSGSSGLTVSGYDDDPFTYDTSTYDSSSSWYDDSSPSSDAFSGSSSSDDWGWSDLSQWSDDTYGDDGAGYYDDFSDSFGSLGHGDELSLLNDTMGSFNYNGETYNPYNSDDTLNMFEYDPLSNSFDSIPMYGYDTFDAFSGAYTPSNSSDVYKNLSGGTERMGGIRPPIPNRGSSNRGGSRGGRPYGSQSSGGMDKGYLDYLNALRNDQMSQFRDNLAWQKSKFSTLNDFDKARLAETKREADKRFAQAENRFNFEKALGLWQNNLAGKQSQFNADITNRNLLNQSLDYNANVRRRNRIANALGRAGDRRSVDSSDLLSTSTIDYSVNPFKYGE